MVISGEKSQNKLLGLILNARMETAHGQKRPTGLQATLVSHADRMAQALREPETAATNSQPCHSPNIPAAERQKTSRSSNAHTHPL